MVGLYVWFCRQWNGQGRSCRTGYFCQPCTTSSNVRHCTLRCQKKKEEKTQQVQTHSLKCPSGFSGLWLDRPGYHLLIPTQISIYWHSRSCETFCHSWLLEQQTWWTFHIKTFTTFTLFCFVLGRNMAQKHVEMTVLGTNVCWHSRSCETFCHSWLLEQQTWWTFHIKTFTTFTLFCFGSKHGAEACRNDCAWHQCLLVRITASGCAYN